MVVGLYVEPESPRAPPAAGGIMMIYLDRC